jgi:hypothetical protein
MAAGSKITDAAGNAGRATDLSPSLVQRVAQGVRYVVSGVTPNSWFGPMQPLTPVAQEQAVGRVLDYPTGYNQRTQPREGEAITFDQLRHLADSCEMVRIAIETRKDQISRLSWNIKPRDNGKEPATNAPTDPRITAIQEFFRFPDKQYDWPTWLREVIEDLLVLDAPAIYRRKDGNGKPYAFNVFDGSKIKRVIDDSGLTPLPPSPAYQQVLHGLPAVDYTTQQLLYMPRNPRSHKIYGFSPVEQIVMTVNIALRRTMVQLSWYTEGNIPEALVGCPPEWLPAQIQEMQERFDSMLSGDLAERSKAKFIPGGLTVQFTKDALLKDEFDEWLARIVCFAFSLPPTAFVKQNNRATADSEKERAEQEGLAPLQMWVKNLMDRLIAEDFGAPDLEFSWYDDTSVDPLQLAQVNNTYVAAGIKTRNEVRSELGLDPVPEGNEITITAGNTVMRLSDALNPPKPIAAPPGDQQLDPDKPVDENGDDPATPKKDKPVAPEKRKKIAKADTPTDDRDLTPTDDKTSHEDELTAIFGTFLRRQRDRIAALIGGTEHTGQTPDAAFADAETSGVLNADALVEPVAQVLEERAVEASQAELKTVTASAGVEPDATATASRLVNQEAIDYAHGRAAEMVGRKLVDGKLVDNPDAKYAITDTTRDGLRKLIETAEVEGKSVQQLANDIRQSALFGKDRARLIAQTELSFADSNGNLIAWKASGVVTGKKSILGNEHKLCDQCDANAKAGVIGLDAAFPSGHQCTPFHPLCACATVPVIAKP